SLRSGRTRKTKRPAWISPKQASEPISRRTSDPSVLPSGDGPREVPARGGRALPARAVRAAPARHPTMDAADRVVAAPAGGDRVAADGAAVPRAGPRRSAVLAAGAPRARRDPGAALRQAGHRRDRAAEARLRRLARRRSGGARDLRGCRIYTWYHRSRNPLYSDRSEVVPGAAAGGGPLLPRPGDVVVPPPLCAQAGRAGARPGQGQRDAGDLPAAVGADPRFGNARRAGGSAGDARAREELRWR